MTQLAEPADADVRLAADRRPLDRRPPGRRPVGPSRARCSTRRRASQAKWVDFASVEEMDAAVAAAKAAFPAWRATSLSKRTEILFRIRNLVDPTAATSRRC